MGTAYIEKTLKRLLKERPDILRDMQRIIRSIGHKRTKK